MDFWYPGFLENSRDDRYSKIQNFRTLISFSFPYPSVLLKNKLDFFIVQLLQIGRICIFYHSPLPVFNLKTSEIHLYCQIYSLGFCTGISCGVVSSVNLPS